MSMLKKRFPRVSLLLTVFFMISCEAKDVETYQADQINEVSVKQLADGNLMLQVMPMMETLYSCPGAIIKETEDTLFVGLVRCHIKKECPVDVVAELDTENSGYFNIIIPGTDKPIKIEYPSGAKQVWP